MTRSKPLVLLMLLASTAIRAEPIEPVERLRGLAEDFLRAQLQTQGATGQLFIEAGALDARLRLPACDKPAAFLPSGASITARTTIGLRCAAPVWSVYVPVTVESELPVLVLRQAAGRGAALLPGDVETQTRRVSGFASHYVAQVTALTGKHLKNATSPGTPLTTELLVPDILIKRGQRVTLLASVGGIEVRAQGEAVSDATPAGRVRVQNLGSQKIVEGQVETSDIVRVGP